MKKSFEEIQGWHSDEMYQLFDIVFPLLEDNASLVNVGTYKGKTLSLMLDYVKNFNIKSNIFTVDTWVDILYGDDGQDIKNIFLENLSDNSDRFTLLELNTCDASTLFFDSSLDFVFLDTSHTFDHVYSEIECWMPKIKPGGILSGHDYHWGQVRDGVNGLIKEVNVIYSKESFEGTYNGLYSKWNYTVWYKRF